MNDSDKNKFLIIRLSSLGDVILSTSVVRELKKQFPGSQIDFLVKEQYVDAVKFNPLITNKYVYPADNITGKLTGILENEKYDAVIDLQNNFRSRKITKELSADLYSYKKPSLKKFLLVRFKINLFRQIKSVQQMYSEACPLIEFDNQPPEFYFTISPKIRKPEKRLAVLCPGSRHFTKMWPVEYFIRLSAKLINSGYEVYVTGGKDDIEICREIAGTNSLIFDYSTGNKLDEIATVINFADVVVCNDSGLMHIASALKKPLAAIFGSTVKEFGFSPLSANSVVIENKELSCRPCSHTGRSNCPKKHFKCMKEITPDSVFNQLQILANG